MAGFKKYPGGKFGLIFADEVHSTARCGNAWHSGIILRSHPEEARTYERLKRRLAAEHREIGRHTPAVYVDSVMQKAIK